MEGGPWSAELAWRGAGTFRGPKSRGTAGQRAVPSGRWRGMSSGPEAGMAPPRPSPGSEEPAHSPRRGRRPPAQGGPPTDPPPRPDSCPRRSLGQMEGPLSFLPCRLSPVGRGWLRRGPWWPGTVTARGSVVRECSWARGRECEAEACGPEVLPMWGQAVGRREGQKPSGGGEGPRAHSLWGFTHL